jgi:hypothetical protein
VSPVRCELGSYIPEDAILHSTVMIIRPSSTDNGISWKILRVRWVRVDRFGCQVRDKSCENVLAYCLSPPLYVLLCSAFNISFLCCQGQGPSAVTASISITWAGGAQRAAANISCLRTRETAQYIKRQGTYILVTLATVQSRTFCLSSRLLSRNVNSRIYETIILPVVSYG